MVFRSGHLDDGLDVATHSDPRPYHVAVVDDDPSFRTALARLLSEVGYRAVLFASAREFLAAAPTSGVACVVIDINLGETSGLDLARQLSAAGFKFPIIFITGSDQSTLGRQCMDFGCVAYLQKPLQENQLIEAIKKATTSDR